MLLLLRTGSDDGLHHGSEGRSEEGEDDQGTLCTMLDYDALPAAWLRAHCRELVITL